MDHKPGHGLLLVWLNSQTLPALMTSSCSTKAFSTTPGHKYLLCLQTLARYAPFKHVNVSIDDSLQASAVKLDAIDFRLLLILICQQVVLPPTLAEAQMLVNGRDEELRKAALRRDKHKQRTSKSKDCFKEAQFPGAVPGAELNKTALWLSTEVIVQSVMGSRMYHVSIWH